MIVAGQCPQTLQMGTGQDQQSAEIVLVEILDRVQQIAVKGHQATESGAKSRVTVRRSVSVQPWGGIMRSAWSAQNEYPPGRTPFTRSSIHTELSG
jgi:hypothetical protein